MSVSIVIDGDLWGLIACHGYGSHGTRVTLPMREREYSPSCHTLLQIVYRDWLLSRIRYMLYSKESFRSLIFSNTKG